MPLQVGDQGFLVGTTAPEADFLRSLDRELVLIIGFTLFAILLSVTLASWLSRWFARPLESLAIEARKLQQLDLSPSEVPSSRFKEIQHVQAEQEGARTALSSFIRYLPMDIVKDLLAKGEVAKIGGESRVMTVLFTDIEGFTTISEGRSPNEVVELLSDYMAVLLEAIKEAGGEVNQLLGDGVEAYWGAPRADAEHAQNAVRGILKTHKAVEAFNVKLAQEGKPSLSTRFGLATGELMVGNVGSKARLSYTAIGDTENLASRIEGLNKYYGTRLLVSENTYLACAEHFEWRQVDRVRVKGKSKPVRLYEPLAEKGKATEEQLRFKQAYENALKAYQKGDFDQALKIREEQDESNLSVKRLIRLSEKALQAGGKSDWDGINDFEVK